MVGRPIENRQPGIVTGGEGIRRRMCAKKLGQKPWIRLRRRLLLHELGKARLHKTPFMSTMTTNNQTASLTGYTNASTVVFVESPRYNVFPENERPGQDAKRLPKMKLNVMVKKHTNPFMVEVLKPSDCLFIVNTNSLIPALIPNTLTLQCRECDHVLRTHLNNRKFCDCQLRWWIGWSINAGLCHLIQTCDARQLITDDWFLVNRTINIKAKLRESIRCHRCYQLLKREVKKLKKSYVHSVAIDGDVELNPGPYFSAMCLPKRVPWSARRMKYYFVIKIALSGNVEKNPGPDTLWELKDFCIRTNKIYNAVFLGIHTQQHSPDCAFKCTIIIGGECTSFAYGANKKQAERNAAELAWIKINTDGRQMAIERNLKELKELQLKLKGLGVEKNRWCKDLTADGDVESNPGPVFLQDWWNHFWLLCSECTSSIDPNDLDGCHPGSARIFIGTPTCFGGDDGCDAADAFRNDPERFIVVGPGRIGRSARKDAEIWEMDTEVYTNYYQWLPNELREESYCVQTFLENCERIPAQRVHDPPLTYMLWDHGAFRAQLHCFLLGKDSDLAIAKYRLRQGDIAEMPDEPNWWPWYRFFRGFAIDYDFENNTLVAAEGSENLHALCNMPITEAHRLAKIRYGMNLKNALLKIRNTWVRDLIIDGDVESNPGPWSPLWHQFSYVVKKMKKAGYADYDARTRSFLVVFKPDNVKTCCDCADDCGASHSFKYYFNFVNALLDASMDPDQSDATDETKGKSERSEESEAGPAPKEKSEPKSEGRKNENHNPSKTEKIVRTALGNRSMVASDAELQILCEHFDTGVFWCNIDNCLHVIFCHPIHTRKISLLHDTLSAWHRGDFVLGNPRPEEVRENERKKEPRAQEQKSNAERSHKRSHPRSKRTKRSAQWQPNASGPPPTSPSGDSGLPLKWRFLEKYWANLKLSDEIGAGVGLSYEILEFWQQREDAPEDEEAELLVVGWAEFAYFTAQQNPTIRPSSIDREEQSYRRHAQAREESVDYVLGPAPYANKLGFFFNEMWLPEHYDALEAEGYSPEWVHQEFCFYKKVRREWNYLEPRFGIRQVPKTPVIRWLWSAEEMSALVVLVDLQCPNLFLNLVQISDGSYAVSGRKCRSLNHSYANYWSVVVDGTVLFQGMKAARSNEQQMMAAHCTHESISFLRGWITNSRIIRGLESVLEHEDVRGSYAHGLKPGGSDLPRPFPDTEPPAPREERQQAYWDLYEPYAEKFNEWRNPEEPILLFPDDPGLSIFSDRIRSHISCPVCGGATPRNGNCKTQIFSCPRCDWKWSDAFTPEVVLEMVPEETDVGETCEDSFLKFMSNWRKIFPDAEQVEALRELFSKESVRVTETVEIVRLKEQEKEKEEEIVESIEIQPVPWNYQEDWFEGQSLPVEPLLPDHPWYGGTVVGDNYELPEVLEKALITVGKFHEKSVEVAGDIHIEFGELLLDFTEQKCPFGKWKAEFSAFADETTELLVFMGLVGGGWTLQRSVEFLERLQDRWGKVKSDLKDYRDMTEDWILLHLRALLDSEFPSLSDGDHIKMIFDIQHPRLLSWAMAGCALLAGFSGDEEVAICARLMEERSDIRDLKEPRLEWMNSSVRSFAKKGKNRYVNGIGSAYHQYSHIRTDGPVIAQMNTTVTIDAVTYSIYEPAPFDPNRLKVTQFFEPHTFSAVRPECIYWVYLFDLYVPSPHSSLWTTVYRCGKTPPKFNRTELAKFKHFADQVLLGMASEMVVNWRSPSWEGLTGPILKETMENMVAKQAKLRYEDFEACRDGEKKSDSHHNRAFTKLDENPGGAKPRHIFNATHWAFQNLQSGLFDVKKGLKKEEEVQYDGFTFQMPQPHVFKINGFTVFVTYMADTDQLQDAYWMWQAMQAGPNEIHIAVGGDDNTSVVNIDGILYQIEGDISMCDQSMHELLCRIFIDFMARLGASEEFLEVLTESYKNPAIFFYKPDAHTPPEIVAIIEFLVWMLFTGVSQTSCHNTVLLFVVVAWVLVAWASSVRNTGPQCPKMTADLLKAFYEKLGIKMKIQVYLGEVIKATYHKKYFITHPSGIVTTSFLIGASLPRILRVRTSTPITEDTFWQRIRDGASSRLPVVAHPVIHSWLKGLADGRVWQEGELAYKGVSSIDVGSKYADMSSDLHENAWMDRYNLDYREIMVLKLYLSEFVLGTYYDIRSFPELEEVFVKMWAVDNS